MGEPAGSPGGEEKGVRGGNLVSPTGASRRRATLTGHPVHCERVEGVWGNREVPPVVRRRGFVGETWFPPRERAEGERRSQGTLCTVSVWRGYGGTGRFPRW